MDNRKDDKPGFLRGLWRFFWRPSSAISLGALLIAGFVPGVVFWGGFYSVLDYTNTE